MESVVKYKIIIGTISTIMLIIAFFIGYAIPLMSPVMGYTLGFLVVPPLILLNFFLLGYVNIEKRELPKKYKFLIWIYLTLNVLFAFIIGITIPYLESYSRNNFGWVMIPLLAVLNFIIIDRFYYYIKHSNDKERRLEDEK